MAGRVEVLGAERRRYWTLQSKVAIVAEAAQPGSSVSLVARRHGLHPNQVFTWRRELRARAATGSAVAFAPVRITPAAAPAYDGLIEIELGDGRRVRVDRHVDADALRRVIAVLEGSR